MYKSTSQTDLLPGIDRLSSQVKLVWDQHVRWIHKFPIAGVRTAKFAEKFPHVGLPVLRLSAISDKVTGSEQKLVYIRKMDFLTWISLQGLKILKHLRETRIFCQEHGYRELAST